MVVVLENHSYDDIVGASLPFLNRLAAGGLVLTSSYGVTHPSQPNYLALFSGSTQGLVDDSCPHTFDGPNLAAALRNAGYTFTGYSEGLPQPGSRTCLAGDYVRKHNPWVDFRTVPAAANQPLTSFPTDFTALPSVSFVIPDLAHDMHDGTPQQSDAWLRAHLESYAQWARTHDSLLVVTADEDDRLSANHIFTVFYGARVRAGRDDVRVDHYGVLRTLLDAFDLTPFGAAASAVAVPGIGTAG